MPSMLSEGDEFSSLVDRPNSINGPLGTVCQSKVPLSALAGGSVSMMAPAMAMRPNSDVAIRNTANPGKVINLGRKIVKLIVSRVLVLAAGLTSSAVVSRSMSGRNKQQVYALSPGNQGLKKRGMFKGSERPLSYLGIWGLASMLHSWLSAIEILPRFGHLLRQAGRNDPRSGP